MGLLGREGSGRWRFDESDERLWLNLTGSSGSEVWILDLIEEVQGGFRAIDNYRRKSIIKRVG
jgi:hypothetical protein